MFARTGGHRRSFGKSSLMPKSRSSKLFVNCLEGFSICENDSCLKGSYCTASGLLKSSCPFDFKLGIY